MTSQGGWWQGVDVRARLESHARDGGRRAGFGPQNEFDPPSAKCVAELNKVCLPVHAEPTLCHDCVKGGVFPDCTSEDLKGYVIPLFKTSF